jgi:hypothetical protein
VHERALILYSIPFVLPWIAALDWRGVQTKITAR